MEIKENKRNKNRVSIFTDDGFLFACEKELIYKHHIKKGDPVDEKILKDLIAEDDYIKAREMGLRQLESSFKTEKQIKDKLDEKGFEEDIIEQVIEKFREYNLVDDKKYTEMFLKEKLRSRGLRKASYELSQKGISKELVAEVSEEINTYDMEEASCRAHGVKKYEQLRKKETDPYKLKNKLFTFLSSKGYDYDLVNSIMGEILTSKKD